MQRTQQPQYTASMLRRELSERAAKMARADNLLHELTSGASPVVLFGLDENGRHGNFHPASYRSIAAKSDWAERLTKVHTHWRKARARADWPWKELDSVNSSDALLMNIFCHPTVSDEKELRSGVAALMGVGADSEPHFGTNPGVPLCSGRMELATEIDMELGDLLVEAKLTETGFQNATPRLIERYRDLGAVFEVSRLPWTPIETMRGYQLIRNALAAFAHQKAFCVLCDGRRYDLIEQYYAVLSAVWNPTFACRLKLLTWQELSAALPGELQVFLDRKYGIVPS